MQAGRKHSPPSNYILLSSRYRVKCTEINSDIIALYNHLSSDRARSSHGPKEVRFHSSTSNAPAKRHASLGYSGSQAPMWTSRALYPILQDD